MTFKLRASPNVRIYQQKLDSMVQNEIKKKHTEQNFPSDKMNSSKDFRVLKQ